MKTQIKWRCALLLLLTCFVLNGCGFKDIDKRFFVVSIGVDAAKDSSKKYLVSLKFAVPGASKESPSEYQIVSQEANSLSEAVRIIKTKVDKEIDFSHAKVLLFSDDIVGRKGNAGMYYWFSRRRDIQKIAWVNIAEPTALAVLKVKPKSEHIPSDALFLALGKEGSETPYITSEFLFDFKYRLIERGIDPIMPIVKAKNDLFEINRVGLFNKSTLKLSLEPEETKMLNFLRNREEKSAIRVEKGDTTIVINTNKVKTNYKLFTPQGRTPFVKVNVLMEGNLEEASKRVPIAKLSTYEAAAEKSINKRIEKLLVKFQKSNLDPIGFGLRYRSRHFNEDDWEQWKSMYSNVVFKVESKVQIEDTGLIE
ncbi:Ger(x)C family spore germination protein [Neobacillus drentensis]|uniref:Ger(x)C family spore germination protein n=1 Tax=Neobacillus drentensis TaxID=220684 RepID=UPI002FFEF5DB